MTRRQLAQYAEDHQLELVFFDPPAHFDAAIVGVIVGFGQEPAVLYDQARVLAAMVADGMTLEDAEEWFAFNTIGAYVGEATPRFLLQPSHQQEDVCMAKKKTTSKKPKGGKKVRDTDRDSY